MRKFLIFCFFLGSFSCFAFYDDHCSILLNPYPNQAPYLVTKEDGTVFNPFAIREVRYSLNNLINRQYLCDWTSEAVATIPAFFPIGYSEIYFGEGTVWQEAGFSFEGNETEAIQTITQALNTAADLPQLSGRLERQGDGFWYFDGEQVQIKFIVRDDYREYIGNYIAAQLEKAGFGVIIQMISSVNESMVIVYDSDPADFEWSAFTEGWGGVYPRFSYASRGFIFRQMYAPVGGYMPGRNTEGFWSYANPELDKKANDLIYSRYFSDSEMKSLYLDMIKIGFCEAIRIQLLVFEIN